MTKKVKLESLISFGLFLFLWWRSLPVPEWLLFLNYSEE